MFPLRGFVKDFSYDFMMKSGRGGLKTRGVFINNRVER
jgi:hypothetical protein